MRRRHTAREGGKSVPRSGRCSVGLGFLQGRAEPQLFLSDPELAGELPPHPPARDRLAPLPCANCRGLDPEQEPELRLAQVSGLAVLAELIHDKTKRITSAFELTSRRGTC